MDRYLKGPLCPTFVDYIHWFAILHLFAAFEKDTLTSFAMSYWNNKHSQVNYFDLFSGVATLPIVKWLHLQVHLDFCPDAFLTLYVYLTAVQFDNLIDNG